MKYNLLACYALIAIGLIPLTADAQEKSPESAKPKFAGPTEKGFLLPNGWHITPVGKQVACNDLPLNIIPNGENAPLPPAVRRAIAFRSTSANAGK